MNEQDYAQGRAVLARVAGMLYERRMTELQGGNMSLRLGDAAVVTPTKVSENTGWRMAPEDTLVQDLDGQVLIGDPAMVSREIRLHLRLYRAYPELGSVFHLHLAESLGAVAAGRWGPGVVTTTTDPYGAAVVVLEADLPAQTEPHDARVVELLGQVERADGALSISPGHGIFSVARDVATNIRAADVFRQRLELERLRGRLRDAREAVPA
jgi:ribulose-5-phosphate 4-epimerase/fuculose-1-phosphate aldolase